MGKISKIFLLIIKRLKLAFLLALICAASGFGLYFSGRNLSYVEKSINVGIIDNDNSFLSERMKSYFADTLEFEYFEENSKKLTDKLINNDISAIIEIPQGMEQAILSGNDIKILTTTHDDYENGAFIGLYIDSFVNSAAVASKGAGGDFEAFKKIMSSHGDTQLSTERIIDGNEANYMGFSFAIGFLVMLAGGVGIFITMAVHDDIDFGTFSRMRISRVTGADYMTATVLASVILNLIVMLPLTLWAVLAGKIPDTNGFLAVFMIVAFSLFLSAFSVLTAIVFRSKQTIATLSGGIISLGCLFGGIWFPIDDSIGAVKYFAYVTPHYWFMEQFRQPEADGNSLVPIAIVSLAAVLLFLISAAIFSKKQSVN